MQENNAELHENVTGMQIQAPDKISANERRTSIKQPLTSKYLSRRRPLLPLQRKDAPGKQPATPRMGYTRIEPEAGGAARLAIPA